MRLRTHPEDRRVHLKNRLADGDIIRLVEAHSGLSARIATTSVGAKGRRFDRIWVSSLTSSAVRCLPDIELNTMERRVDLVREVLFAVDEPVVVDVDTGGEIASLVYLCQKLDTMGVSAVIIEDKRHPKRNSFNGTTVDLLEDPDAFAKKLMRVKAGLAPDKMMVFARIEALVAGATMENAIARAEAYVSAGADGIMIHSKSPAADEVLEFARRFSSVTSEVGRKVPLVCVPTTYNSVTGTSLEEAGFDIVIYANHLLRSSIKAMKDTCSLILDEDRTAAIEDGIAPVSEVFEITDYFQALEADR